MTFLLSSHCAYILEVPITNALQPNGYDPSYWELFRRYIAAANISSIGQVSVEH